MEAPLSPQVSVSGSIIIHGQLTAPSSQTAENVPLVLPPEWQFWHWKYEKLTAYATLLLATGTMLLAIFSYVQWKTMQRQMKDDEAKTSAHLIIEDFNPTLSMGEPGQGMFIRGSVKVTNDGSSVAREIYFDRGFSGSMTPPDPLPELKPIPVPNGASLGQGKSIEFPIGYQEGQ
jgi:hypothetical protein